MRNFVPDTNDWPPPSDTAMTAQELMDVLASLSDEPDAGSETRTAHDTNHGEASA